MWLLEAAIVPLFLGALLVSGGAVPYAQFTSGVNLVEVYATVTDGHGEPVAGLTAADFQIVEDGVGQADLDVCGRRVSPLGRGRHRSQLQHGRQG